MSVSPPVAISVVVPMYDVERYLGECLDSLAAQTFGDFEAILVDDGSTDDSGRIADVYAERDSRFRVIHQANAGLGAARNVGARHATGEYLAFVDSDDLLHRDAYAAMISSLRRSGSDFATGNVHRLTSLGLRQSPMYAPVCAEDRIATHVSREPVLFVDRIAPNKLFRRSFWTDHGFAFPEGVAYEDISVIIPAHVLARSVDVLSSHVYVWRQRSGADRSITQRRLEIPNMRDRFRAVTAASAFLGEHGYDAEKRAYDRVAMTDELRLFSSQLDRADPEYAEDLVANGQRFLSQAHPDALEGAPAIERLKWHLIAEGAVDEVVRVARFDRVEAARTPAIRKRGRVYGDLPFRRGRRPRIPRRVFEYGPELRLETRITGYHLDARRITVEGWAYIRHVAVPDERAQRVTMTLVDAATDERLPMTVEAVACPDATARAKPDVYDYHWAGFRASVPIEELTSRWESGVRRWHVDVEVSAGRIVRSGRLAGPDAGRARRAPFTDVGRLRVGPRVDGSDLTIVVAARPVVLVAGGADGGRLRLEVESKRDLTHLRLTRPNADDLVAELTGTGPRRFVATLPVAWFDPEPDGPLARRDLTWSVHGVAQSGRSARLIADQDVDQFVAAAGDREVSLEITRYGNVSIGSRRPALWLEEVAVAEGGFDVVARFSGELPPGHEVGQRGALRVGLEPNDRLDLRWLPTGSTGDGRLAVHVPAVAFPAVGGARPLPAGTWRFVARHHAADGTERDVDLRLPRSVTAKLPMAVEPGHKRIELDDLSWQRPAVVVGDDLDVTERGRYHQERLWRAASSGRTTTDVALFVSSSGRSGGGCPRALAEELRRREPGLELRWAVEDQQAPVPDDLVPIRVGGREWHESLASARFVVTDGPLPDVYRRRDGQVCVRLWSGVPIRPVGRDDPSIGPADRASRAAVVEAAGQWSHLVSPGPFASGILREAFGYDGAVLEVGHPRHDVLARPDLAAARVEAARLHLGIPAGAPVALYAPTRFDHLRHPGGRFRLALDADLDGLRAAAGDDAWLLVRSHPDVDDGIADATDDPRILDVSAYPDLVALALLADVAITHASSVALDMARAGTPLVVHDPPDAPIDEQGPLYVDLRTDVPWAVASGRDELLGAVGQAITAGGAVVAGYAPVVDAYADIARGGATAAVVDAMLAGEPSA